MSNRANVIVPSAFQPMPKDLSPLDHAQLSVVSRAIS